MVTGTESLKGAAARSLAIGSRRAEYQRHCTLCVLRRARPHAVLLGNNTLAHIMMVCVAGALHGVHLLPPRWVSLLRCIAVPLQLQRRCTSASLPWTFLRPRVVGTPLRLLSSGASP